MTDVAPIVLTASAITVVLQIVLIALVIDTRKKLKREPAPEPSARPETPEVRKPREPENRFNRRPQQEQRNRPAPVQPQNVEQVERSLRDINLRLKNAERDQEKERKRIKDSIGAPGQRKFDHQKPRERDEGYRRNDRQRHDFHHPRTSDSQRQPREDRAGVRNSFEIKDPVPQSPAPAPEAQQPPVSPIAAPILVTQPPSPEPVMEVTEAGAEQKENLQHGRKVMVKRRVLNLEEESAAIRTDASSDSAEPKAASAAPQTRESDAGPGEEQSSEGTPIQFGR